MPELLFGTIDSVDVAEAATHAEVLPGGTVAFVGSASRNMQVGYPAWLGPGLVPLPSGGHTGNGVIDASPAYSFNPAERAAVSAPGAIDLTEGVAHISLSGLAGFNRLPEYNWSGGGPQGSLGGALYTVALPARAAPSDPQNPAAAAAPPAQQTTTHPDRRHCTAQDRSQDCR
jgi:hypothetical protein